ncbi:MAG: hypothetical protein ACLSHP_06035 [Coprococcus sp.]
MARTIGNRQQVISRIEKKREFSIIKNVLLYFRFIGI